MKFNRDKLGTKSEKYWTNISDYKPVGWKVVDGKKRIYSNFVDIIFSDYSFNSINKYIDSIEIKYHVDYNRNIDYILNLENSILNGEELNFGYIYRDRKIFPFIESIRIYSKEKQGKYLIEKKNRERKLKFKKLINEN